MEVLDSLVFPEVAANEESENGQYPSSLAFPVDGCPGSSFNADLPGLTHSIHSPWRKEMS